MSAGDFTNLRKFLESEAVKRNRVDELSAERPDPLIVARKQWDERAILLCALFGYGNAKKIVEFLNSLDFALLDADETAIRRTIGDSRYYRFQNPEDVTQIFLTLRRVERGALRETFKEGYKADGRVIDGVFRILQFFASCNSYESRGYRFLTGTVPTDRRPVSPYKRWMMFLRWMVRDDNLDLGLWHDINRADLVIPLDTHTFHVAQRIGLLKRKTYDWKAAVELTKQLKRFSPEDPVKYDFALYRIGQENVEL